MLLKLSLLVFLISNIFVSDFRVLLLLFGASLVLNFVYNKNLRKHLKRIKILLFFYASTFIIQLFYSQQGKVLFKIYNFYITETGLINFGTNFIRVVNLILLSWVVNEANFFKGKFSKYEKVIEIVIELVPQVFVIVKKRMKLKYFYRHILKEIKKRYYKEA